jgi:hypothetical protein
MNGNSTNSGPNDRHDDEQAVHDSGHSNGPNDKEVTITIDGVSYTPDVDHQHASALLWMAGVDPAHYDLAMVKHNGQTQVFRDEKIINLKDGDAFVTVRQSAQVA